jgi:hypothetical protein
MKMMRYNEGKPELSHVLEFPTMLEEWARVCAVGARKYERGNWKLGGRPREEFLDSAMRHLLAMANGEEFYREHDENGEEINVVISHAAAVVWNLAALVELESQQPSAAGEEDATSATSLEEVGVEFRDPQPLRDRAEIEKEKRMRLLDTMDEGERTREWYLYRRWET